MGSTQTDLRDDGARIDVNDYFELRSWAKRYGVPAAAVRQAVARVGDLARDVETYLAFEQSMAGSQPGWMGSEP